MPSLVTWPTSIVATPLAFAAMTSACAHSRTWVTEPGARTQLRVEDGLDRIDDKQVGLDLRHRTENRGQCGLGDDPHLVELGAKPLRT